MRHLSERQMPTNIALIVCDKILTDGCALEELPFVDDVTLDLSEAPGIVRPWGSPPSRCQSTSVVYLCHNLCAESYGLIP
jgi:hypothetical protein